MYNCCEFPGIVYFLKFAAIISGNFLVFSTFPNSKDVLRIIICIYRLENLIQRKVDKISTIMSLFSLTKNDVSMTYRFVMLFRFTEKKKRQNQNKYKIRKKIYF